MSEQTEKASPKPRKAPAGKRAPRKARPSSPAATAPGGTPAKSKAGADKSEAKARSPKPTRGKAVTAKARPVKSDPDSNSNDARQPPDPATVVFGSNRPIVAPPPPKPESSGLRFSGPSDGVLKSSGPQTTAPKAEGLTFAGAKSDEVAPPLKQGETSAAKKAPAKNRAADSPLAAKPAAKGAPDSEAKNGEAATGKESPAAAKGKAKDANDKATDSKGNAAKTAKPNKTGAPTKPAIAPQNHGPLIEKSGSRTHLPLTLVCLAAVVAGLVWLLSNQAPPQETLQSAPQTAGNADELVPDQGSVEQPAAALAEANPTPAEAEAVSPPIQPAGAAVTALSTSELREVKDLLQKIGLDSGSGGDVDAVLRAAIRDYQTMAGLPVDGEATPALLEELRAVAALYGN